MLSTLNKVLDGYGSFFALSHPASRILIFICAMLQPYSGLCGLLGALSVILWRRLLQFNADTERIEIINGILLGSLIGSMYAFSPISLCLTVCGGLLLVLVSAIFSDTVGKLLRLPLLGLPYALVAFLLLPLAAALRLPHAIIPISHWQIPCYPVLPLGAMYFNGTGLGGLIVLLAFCLSSRYLALLAIAASVCSSIFLHVLGVPADSILALVARMNSVLAACVIGGLFAVPGKKSLAVSAAAAIFAAGLSLALNQLLSTFGLPVLALPFVLVTCICMLAFNSQRGPAWTYFWLTVPALPESSLELIQIGKARGVDYRFIGLKAPFKGVWQVYQGFGGAHTHQGNWQYALDFFQTDSGISFSGDGSELSDYHCFAKPVLSPAYGVVVELRNDLADNEPGEVDTVNNWGNFVLIKLESGACVILCHLQQGSVKVQLGSRVCPGEQVASVGNSGRSPQPHLHMHVQENAYIGSKTIPFHLAGVIVQRDGKDFYEMRSVPAENELVSIPSSNTALKRSLKFAVGNRYLFRVENTDGTMEARRLEVSLDLNGQFWLESDRGARVAFSVTEELLAFYNRQGEKDLLMDAFVLSFASTPILEGDLCWNDAAPGRLLPRSWIVRLSHAILYPFVPCTRSSYKRSWDPILRVWKQTGEHKIAYWSCSTNAHLCEAQGLIDFELQLAGKSLLKAQLISLGVKEDNGIPEWNATLPQVS